MAIFIKEQYAIVPIEWIEGQNVEIQGGTLIKISGGDGWNAGAQSSQITEGKSFVIEFIPDSTDTRIAFGLDEGRDSIEYNNKSIDYTWEINPDGLNEINVRETNEYRGTYNAGDIFQVMFLEEVIYFLQNDIVMHTFPSANDFPYFADCSIYLEGKSFTPTLYIEAEPQIFTQTATLNIALTDLSTSDYTAVGYNFEQSVENPFSMIQSGAQDYTAIGYNFEQTAVLNFALIDASTTDYTPIGYSFEQSTETSIFLNDLAYQWITLEGYDLQQSTLDYIYLLDSASQAYTPRGYSYEQTSLEDLAFVQTANQDYTAIGYSREQTTAENISLSFSASQDYTANGYSFEQTTLEEISLAQDSLQEYTAIGYTRETSALNYFGLLFSATSKLNNQGYSFHQIALNIIDLDITSNKTHTESHPFVSNAVENLALLDASTQEYGPIGYSYEQTVEQNINFVSFGSEVFQANFEQSTNEIFYIGFEAVQEYTAIGLTFDQTANEIINPLTTIANEIVLYSKGLPFSAGPLFIDQIALITTIEKVFVPFGGFHFDMTASQPISLNETAILIWEQGQEGHFSQRATAYLYLQEATTKTYEQIFLNFTTQTAQSFSLDFSASSEHKIIFDQEAIEVLELSASASSLYELVKMNFQANTLEDITLSIEAISEFTEAHIFEATASQIIEQNIIAINNYQNINAFASETFHAFGLVSNAVSEYLHVHVFNSIATNEIILDQSAIFIITTEPRDHITSGALLLKLKIWVQVQFESDIYKPTYAKEITKPNTLWEPLEVDRAMVQQNKIPTRGADISDTIFANSHSQPRKERRFSFGAVKPSVINYESESIKKDSLYTLSNEDQLKQDERGLSID